MKINILILLSTALLSIKGFACSPIQAEYVRLDKNPLENLIEEAPAKPVVKVHKIYRGYRGDEGDSCSDTGIVILSIEPTGQEDRTAYTFEIISSETDDVIFQKGLYKGYRDKETGNYMYSFPWIDGASDKQEALDLEVEITPYKLSGVKGNSVRIQVKDKGRE